jgi:L-ascorbate metabolism protein UlaG (beta-lactamase superfamily)
MLVKYLAHASFLITSQEGIKIITDPYTPGNGINYRPVDASADAVTCSHGHSDHSNTQAVKGNPVVLSVAGSQTVKGIPFRTVVAFHDEAGGKKRGSDLIFCFRVDGLDLCHLGDLGHRLSQQQITSIGNVDILFIPVGGFFTIDAVEAAAVAGSLKPRLVFPMHYKTPRADYPIAGVEDFIKDKRNVRRLSSSEMGVEKAGLPASAEIIVLKPAN